ncbi:MAG: hypothetical protein EOO41_04020, partial [Methanobacteriota archaeon]
MEDWAVRRKPRRVNGAQARLIAAGILPLSSADVHEGSIVDSKFDRVPMSPLLQRASVQGRAQALREQRADLQRTFGSYLAEQSKEAPLTMSASLAPLENTFTVRSLPDGDSCLSDSVAPTHSAGATLAKLVSGSAPLTRSRALASTYLASQSSVVAAAKALSTTRIRDEDSGPAVITHIMAGMMHLPMHASDADGVRELALEGADDTDTRAAAAAAVMLANTVGQSQYASFIQTEGRVDAAHGDTNPLRALLRSPKRHAAPPPTRAAPAVRVETKPRGASPSSVATSAALRAQPTEARLRWTSAPQRHAAIARISRRLLLPYGPVLPTEDMVMQLNDSLPRLDWSQPQIFLRYVRAQLLASPVFDTKLCVAANRLLNLPHALMEELQRTD